MIGNLPASTPVSIPPPSSGQFVIVTEVGREVDAHYSRPDNAWRSSPGNAGHIGKGETLTLPCGKSEKIMARFS